MWHSVCAERYPDEYFDFIYVDARHDFKGVTVDMEAWWPKLRPGGIFAGRDYMTQAEVTRAMAASRQSAQDWTINFDVCCQKVVCVGADSYT